MSGKFLDATVNAIERVGKLANWSAQTVSDNTLVNGVPTLITDGVDLAVQNSAMAQIAVNPGAGGATVDLRVWIITGLSQTDWHLLPAYTMSAVATRIFFEVPEAAAGARIYVEITAVAGGATYTIEVGRPVA